MNEAGNQGVGASPARRERRSAPLLGVMALALVARLAVFAVDARHDPPFDATQDTSSYMLAAQTLRGLEDNENRPHRLGERTIGYPGLLALCFELRIGTPEEPRPVILVQILLGALCAGLAWAAAGAVAGPTAALAAGVLVALEPSGLAYPNVLLSETLYTFLMAAVMAAWAALAVGGGPGTLFALGAALGMAPLVKPVAMFLPFVFVPVAALALPRTPGGRLGLALLFLTALVPSALAAAHNRAEIGRFTLSRQGPLQQAIFAYDVERALGIPEPPAGSPEAVWEFNYGKTLGLSRDEIDERRSAFVWRVLPAHPFVAARLALLNFVEMIGVPGDMLATQVLEEPPSFEGGSVVSRLHWLVELRALGLYLLVGMAVSVLGIAAIPFLAWHAPGWTARHRAAVGGIAFLVLYQYALSSFATGQGARYRAPVVPALCVLVALGALELLRTRVSRPGTA